MGKGKVPGTSHGVSSWGWIDMEIFSTASSSSGSPSQVVSPTTTAIPSQHMPTNVRIRESVIIQLENLIMVALLPWLESNHSLQHDVSERPLWLLLDGHSSHYDPEAIRLARANVILFTLLPHTTHQMQPLDTAVFASVKMH